MEQREEPAIIILDTWRQVRAFENALKACNMMSFRDIIVDHIVSAICDSDMCWANLLEVVAEIKHSQGPKLRERDLQRLAMAVGDLGMAAIEELTHKLGLYAEGKMLPYIFGGFSSGALVLKRESKTLMRAK